MSDEEYEIFDEDINFFAAQEAQELFKRTFCNHNSEIFNAIGLGQDETNNDVFFVKVFLLTNKINLQLPSAINGIKVVYYLNNKLFNPDFIS